MSTFKSALAICGLTYDQAAEYFESIGLGPVSKATIMDMSRGKSLIGNDKWEALADLYQRIEDAADFTSANLESGLMDGRVKSNVRADDGEDPLPGHGADVAGAMALLMAVRDTREE